MGVTGRTTMVASGRGLDRLREAIRALDLMKATVRIGFLEDKGGADIHDPESGLTMAELAEVHEFGTEIQMPARQQTIYKSVYTKDRYDKDGICTQVAGSFRYGGRFVKRAKANWSSTHAVGPYVIVIPERSFLRKTADVNRVKIRDAGVRLVTKAAQNLEDGTLGPDGIDQMLGKWGAFTEGLVKRTVQKGVPPPNAPATIRAKRSAKPLIDTGQLVQSIRYGVKR